MKYHIGDIVKVGKIRLSNNKLYLNAHKKYVENNNFTAEVEIIGRKTDDIYHAKYLVGFCDPYDYFDYLRLEKYYGPSAFNLIKTYSIHPLNVNPSLKITSVIECAIVKCND